MSALERQTPHCTHRLASTTRNPRPAHRPLRTTHNARLAFAQPTPARPRLTPTTHDPPPTTHHAPNTTHCATPNAHRWLDPASFVEPVCSDRCKLKVRVSRVAHWAVGVDTRASDPRSMTRGCVCPWVATCRVLGAWVWKERVLSEHNAVVFTCARSSGMVCGRVQL